MNSQMGSTVDYSGGAYRLYKKGGDLVCPTPSDAFIFTEESMWTLEDGYFQVFSGTSASFPNLPGSYHKWSGGLSFADGHAILRSWKSAAIRREVVFDAPHQVFTTTATDPDLTWLWQHAACPP